MPYKTIGDLPESVRDNVPTHAQEIYRAAFNSAWDEYADSKDRQGDASREETAHRVAWLYGYDVMEEEHYRMTEAA